MVAVLLWNLPHVTCCMCQSCIRGTAPQATSFYALISAIVFCIYSLLSVC